MHELYFYTLNWGCCRMVVVLLIGHGKSANVCWLVHAWWVKGVPGGFAALWYIVSKIYNYYYLFIPFNSCWILLWAKLRNYLMRFKADYQRYRGASDLGSPTCYSQYSVISLMLIFSPWITSVLFLSQFWSRILGKEESLWIKAGRELYEGHCVVLKLEYSSRVLPVFSDSSCRWNAVVL